MNKTIAWRSFSKWLWEKGYSKQSKNGNPSTTYDYPSRIDRIRERENLSSLDELGEHILEFIEKYGENGSESEYGNQSNGSNLKALKLFLEFYKKFDTGETL